ALLHQQVDGEQAARIAGRLKLSNAERDRICWLIEKHYVLHDAPTMRKSELKQILIHPGIEDLFLLHRAIASAFGVSAAHVGFAEERLREWTANGELNPPFLITGDDLKQLGIPPGPQYKRLLDAVREAQLDGTISTKEQALELVQKLRGTSEQAHG
ncbi:MAG TPA: hypothetical protein VKS79_24360, partial [Gemmataceae bacterium]|nr:hypothetical protein [Gemmataceae bacterium]